MPKCTLSFEIYIYVGQWWDSWVRGGTRAVSSQCSGESEVQTHGMTSGDHFGAQGNLAAGGTKTVTMDQANTGTGMPPQ